MTAEEFLSARTAPLQLVILDCDGVIVDSEGISNRVLAEDITARGWRLTADEAEHLFIGNSIEAIQPRVEASIDVPLPSDWRTQIKDKIVAALSREAVPIPGALESMRALTAMGMAWRIASNSSHAEMAAKFARLGIADMVAGKVHSYEDVAHGKPAPDLFLAAASAATVPPRACLVVEDSVPGTMAAVAAGMDCLGFDRSADGSFLRAAGAVPFHDMARLPALVALTRRVAA